ncbi:MAG: ribosomal-protein-alanine N-acetyltransferase [Acidimicrobiaceae bacterium]|jgi:ribosomal-protein-alanine N-acetyltransferase|nr:ribosomal-protein-alanine N-acetyltransferase [Acidimicrobiaceae bacterium]|tara:strand:- start:41757 stop:42293 length:537 start_codon:yes stop_codon:yes gene_type:complete
MRLGLEVRTVSLEDLEDLLELDEESFFEPWSISLWELELSRKERIYIGAFNETELVGFIGGLLAYTDFHITTVATKKKFRGSGIASVLLCEIFKRIEDLRGEVDSITLEVRASNKPAQGLYRKFGFAPVGLRRGYYQADNEDAIIMSLENLQCENLVDKLLEIKRKLSVTVSEGVAKQ